MRCCVLQLRVGFLELRVVFTSPGIQVRVIDEQNGRDREHGDGRHRDRERQPALVRRSRTGAERPRREAGRRHARVVHAADGKAHDECRADAGDPHDPGGAFAKAEEQPNTP